MSESKTAACVSARSVRDGWLALCDCLSPAYLVVIGFELDKQGVDVSVEVGALESVDVVVAKSGQMSGDVDPGQQRCHGFVEADAIR
jgi:hypothetical protein